MSETDQGLRLSATPEVGGELCPVLSVDVVHGPAPHYPAAVVTVAGELDAVGAEILDSAWVAGRAALPPSVVLDLQQVSFCNAAGLRVLARIADSCRAGGIRLQSSCGPRLKWLLDLVGVRLDAPDGDQRTCMSAPTGWPDDVRRPDRPQASSPTATRALPTPSPVAAADPPTVGAGWMASVAWVTDLAARDVEDIMSAVLDAAHAAIGSALECASVMLLTRRDQPHPRASSGHLGTRFDADQLLMRQGPSWHSCLRADDVFVGDLRDPMSTRRWPQLTQVSLDLPIRAAMSVHLSGPGRPLGCLTFLATQPHAFDQSDRQIARVLAAMASMPLQGAMDRERGRSSSSRDILAQATDIVMDTHQLTADQALDHLKEATGTTRSNLVDLAEYVTLTGDIPPPRHR